MAIRTFNKQWKWLMAEGEGVMTNHPNINRIHLRHLAVEALDVILRGSSIGDRELVLKIYQYIIDDEFCANLKLLEAADDVFRIRIGRSFEVQFLNCGSWVSTYLLDSRKVWSVDYDGCHSGQIRLEPFVESAQRLIHYAHDIKQKAEMEDMWLKEIAALKLKNER